MTREDAHIKLKHYEFKDRNLIIDALEVLELLKFDEPKPSMSTITIYKSPSYIIAQQFDAYRINIMHGNLIFADEIVNALMQAGYRIVRKEYIDKTEKEAKLNKVIEISPGVYEYYNTLFSKYGVVVIQQWPEGLVFSVGGEIRYKSWQDDIRFYNNYTKLGTVKITNKANTLNLEKGCIYEFELQQEFEPKYDQAYMGHFKIKAKFVNATYIKNVDK
jgi:hypothetical protein